jgi:hypothetical protein
MGPGSQKPPDERDAHRAKSRRLRRPTRQESTLEIMARLLARRVSVSVNGHAKQVSASEAIVLQLIQRAISRNGRARRALLKYELANSRSARSTEVRFVESDYTRAVAKSPSRSDDG